MPRASQDYTDEEYCLIKQAAQQRDMDIRAWIHQVVTAYAREQLVFDAQQTLERLKRYVHDAALGGANKLIEKIGTTYTLHEDGSAKETP